MVLKTVTSVFLPMTTISQMKNADSYPLYKNPYFDLKLGSFNLCMFLTRVVPRYNGIPIVHMIRPARQSRKKKK